METPTIGLGVQVLVDDGPGGTFVALNNVIDVTWGDGKVGTEFRANLGSGPVKPSIASLEDPGTIKLTQEYTSNDWQRNWAIKQSTLPGGAYASRNLKVLYPDGFNIVFPVIWTDVPPQTVTADKLEIMKADMKVAGAPTVTNATPTVTAVSPGTGSGGGGTVVTITGTNLALATGVMFGTNPATNVSVSGNTVTATSPSGTGTVDITVVTPGGTTATSSADQFVYSVPTVTGVTPTGVGTAGGAPVIITGTNFTAATNVKFGTVAATVFIVVSSTMIYATTPAQSAATVHTTVINAAGTSATSSADEVTYS